MFKTAKISGKCMIFMQKIIVSQKSEKSLKKCETVFKAGKKRAKMPEKQVF